MLSSSKYVCSYHHTTGFGMGITMTFSHLSLMGIIISNIIANNPNRAHCY